MEYSLLTIWLRLMLCHFGYNLAHLFLELAGGVVIPETVAVGFGYDDALDAVSFFQQNVELFLGQYEAGVTEVIILWVAGFECAVAVDAV